MTNGNGLYQWRFSGTNGSPLKVCHFVHSYWLERNGHFYLHHLYNIFILQSHVAHTQVINITQGLCKLIDRSNSSCSVWKNIPFDMTNFQNLNPEKLAKRKAPQESPQNSRILKTFQEKYIPEYGTSTRDSLLGGPTFGPAVSWHYLPALPCSTLAPQFLQGHQECHYALSRTWKGETAIP